MNRCELCKGRARLHCASDQASLCWDCDAKVHSANFLVARHFRNLLCHVCQSPMPWSASGVKLGPTISVCEKCVVGRGRKNAESDEEEEAAEEDQQEEIQVVPWSPPPAVEESTCTSIGDGDELISRKRIRIENASSPDLQLKSTCTTTPPHPTESLCTRRTMLQQKIQRKESGRVEECGSAILNSLRRLHREETGSGGEMAEVCSLSGPLI